MFSSLEKRFRRAGSLTGPQAHVRMSTGVLFPFEKGGLLERRVMQRDIDWEKWEKKLLPLGFSTIKILDKMYAAKNREKSSPI